MEKDRKNQQITIVVLGLVSAGKSTAIGCLISLCGGFNGYTSGDQSKEGKVLLPAQWFFDGLGLSPAFAFSFVIADAPMLV